MLNQLILKHMEPKTAVKKSKKWNYHTSHSFTWIDGDKEHKFNFATQLYQIGVYGIMNNDSSMQGSFTPSKLVSMEKKLNKDLENGVIKDLEFGRSITVTTDPDGFFVEVE
jgi:ribosome biogenesis protein Nip4